MDDSSRILPTARYYSDVIQPGSAGTAKVTVLLADLRGFTAITDCDGRYLSGMEFTSVGPQTESNVKHFVQLLLQGSHQQVARSARSLRAAVERRCVTDRLFCATRQPAGAQIWSVLHYEADRRTLYLSRFWTQTPSSMHYDTVITFDTAAVGDPATAVESVPGLLLPRSAE